MPVSHSAKKDEETTTTTEEHPQGPGPDSAASTKAEADRVPNKELNVATSPVDLHVMTPGYEDAVAANESGGSATASECTFPGCTNGRVEFSYMCQEHTDAHAQALEDAQSG